MTQPVKYYLAAYNFVAFMAWALYLLSYFTSGLIVYGHVLLLLNIAQGLAVFEIIHALMKWVKSPVLSTIAQVSSRILVLVLINFFFYTETVYWVKSFGIIIVSIAWGITELVRYSLYFISLFNTPPARLVWMRYSFFIILYPLGVAGEWLILATPLAINGFSFNAYTVFLLVAFVAYAYYFPVLYKYMWTQRKLKLQ